MTAKAAESLTIAAESLAIALFALLAFLLVYAG
jgi:hypothetical protein